MSVQRSTTTGNSGNGRRKLLGIVLYALSAGAFGVGTGLHLTTPAARKQCSRLATTTALLLDDRRHSLVAEATRLAKKFGRWEIRPPAAIKAAIRSTLRERVDIDEIAVFDADGMALQSYCVTTPPGDESKGPSMDVEDWRRKKLRNSKVPLESYRVVAGRANSFEASAPILDDTFQGYVVARISIKHLLSGLPSSKELTVRDDACLLLPSGTGCDSTRPAGPWRVLVDCGTRPAWPFFLAGCLLLLAGTWLTWIQRTATRTEVAGR